MRVGCVVRASPAACGPSVLVVQVAREVKEGTFRGRVIEETMAAGAIAVVYNPALADVIPPIVRADVDAVEAAVRARTLAVPHTEF